MCRRASWAQENFFAEGVAYGAAMLIEAAPTRRPFPNSKTAATPFPRQRPQSVNTQPRFISAGYDVLVASAPPPKNASLRKASISGVSNSLFPYSTSPEMASMSVAIAAS